MLKRRIPSIGSASVIQKYWLRALGMDSRLRGSDGSGETTVVCDAGSVYCASRYGASKAWAQSMNASARAGTWRRVGYTKDSGIGAGR